MSYGNAGTPGKGNLFVGSTAIMKSLNKVKLKSSVDQITGSNFLLGDTITSDVVSINPKQRYINFKFF